MKYKRAAAACAAGVLLCCSAALAAGGGAADPLISKSYVDGDYTTQTLTKAVERIEQRHDALYQEAAAGLKSAYGALASRVGTGGGAGTGTGTYYSAFTDLRVKEGDQIQVSAGSGFLLLAGTAGLSCTGNKAIDLTSGWEKGTGALEAGRRYLVAEDTVATLTVTSPTAVLSLEGYHTLTESASTDYNTLAAALRTMGLFQGSGTGYGSGFDLEAAPTRIQGLILFLRLIGEEEAALASTAACPFTDVPDWCQSYAAYAYQQGYTRGMDAENQIFGTNDTLTARQYVTFLLRALGYQDSGENPDFTWDTVLSRAVELGVLTPGEEALLNGEPFLRAQVVYLSYFALDAPCRDGSGSLLDRLTAAGLLDGAVARVVRSTVTVSRLP